MSLRSSFVSVLLLVGLMPTVKADLQTGLVAYYPFDGNANDFSGTGRNGTAYNGVAYVPGVKGMAASFNGINAHIKASSDGLPKGERTVSLWLFANTIKMPRLVLLGYGGITCGTSWFMMLDPPPSPPFYISGHCHSYDLWGPAPSSQEPIGAWYHLAVTTSQTGTQFFVNGQKTASNPLFVNNTAVIPGRDLMIGVDVGPDGYGPYTDVNVGYFDGLMDELRIYNRALSQDEILQLYNGTANVTISSLRLSAVQMGTFSSQQLEAQLGTAPFSWSIVSGSLPSGMTLSSGGLISGTPTVAGSFPLTIKLTDSQKQVAQKDFELDVLLTLPPPDIRIHKTGTLAVPGRTLDYFILIENVGTTEVDNSLIEEQLIQPNFDIKVFNYVSSDPQADFVQDGLALLWAIPPIKPGENQILHYRAKLNASLSVGTQIVGSACSDNGSALSALQAHMAATQGICSICVKACNLAYCSGLDRCIESCEKEFPDPLREPAKKVCISACSVAFAQCSGCLAGCADSCKGDCLSNPVNCQSCPDGCSCHQQPVKAALDPNEKEVAPTKFIQPTQLLLYPIHFENIGTAEARDVFITDVLDPNLDISTLHLLTPGASFDTATSTVQWSLLNRNLPPGGTDNVLLSIRPKPNLPSGTIIRNKATIQFEVFQPLNTNEVVNIIDSTRPICKMNPLPARTAATDIPLAWAGIDAVGQVDSYSVLVSQNNGPFTTLLDHVQNTNTVFKGQRGSTYGFLCVAKDTAGNIEVKGDVADVTTTVQLPTDVSNQVNVTQNGFGRNHATNIWTSIMTVKNISTSPISGPVQVVLNKLSSNATMVNSTGVIAGLGPFITVSAASLPPGASVSVPIQFTNPSSGIINFTPITYSGGL